MAEKKSILQEALLDIKKIQEALNSNTKEILRTVGKEEIDRVVKESIEGDYEEEDMSGEDDEAFGGETDVVATAGAEDAGDELGLGGEDQLGGEEALSGDEEIDMTAASDEDIISVYKKMSGNDEIEIVGDEIRLTVSEPGEYVIKTSELMGGANSEEDLDAEFGGEEMDSEFGDEEMDSEEGSDDETEYEIEMGDEESEDEMSDDEESDIDMGGDEEEESEESEEETEEDETLDEVIQKGTNMSVGSHANKTATGSIAKDIKGPGAKNESIAKAKLVETVGKYNRLLSEAKKLKSENDEMKQSLVKFRNMLTESVVFNSNLTYVTKLFTEFATTKDEKNTIISRFDNEVSSIKESKKLYSILKNELTNKKTITESIDNKITKDISSGSSKVLTESTAYIDPSTKRILDLIKRVERK
jgi:hypothetical protein